MLSINNGFPSQLRIPYADPGEPVLPSPSGADKKVLFLENKRLDPSRTRIFLDSIHLEGERSISPELFWERIAASGFVPAGQEYAQLFLRHGVPAILDGLRIFFPGTKWLRVSDFSSSRNDAGRLSRCIIMPFVCQNANGIWYLDFHDSCCHGEIGNESIIATIGRRSEVTVH